MKVRHSLLLILFILIFQSTTALGQTTEMDVENTEISILTCRSGNELYSTFGHTAIRIFNPSAKLDYVYNYGLFSFNTPNFYLKFMRGQLPYLLGATQMSNFLAEYNYDKRSVFEQVLILDTQQKREIIEFLIENAKPENRAYKYDFFYDNCATRVVDVYSLSGEIKYSNDVEQKTFRELLKENLHNLVWSDFGIDLVIGARADILTNRRDQMFLPEYVMSNLASAKVDGSKPLAKPAHLVLDFEELNENRKEKSTNWPLICTSLLLLFTLLVNILKPKLSKIYNKVFLVMCGVLGLFLLFMWFGTNHGATRDNWNVLWLNPLLLVYTFAHNMSKRITRYILMSLLLVSALNCLVTFLPQFFNLAFLPIILAIISILYLDFTSLHEEKPNA